MSPFFELLQVALRTRDKLSRVPNAIQWEEMLDESDRQAITGVMFNGIERLKKHDERSVDDLSLDLFLEWGVLTHVIEEQSKVMNQRSAEVIRMFEEAGFEACVLKGQGNALMYPTPMRRQPGDIDVWVRPKRPTVYTDTKDITPADTKRYFERNRKEILKYVLERIPEVKVKEHHVDYPVYEDTEVEVHFFPMYLKNPFAMRRLLHLFYKEADEQFTNEVRTATDERLIVPTVRFNVIFQLVHVYLHYLNQGIGLRHIVDYFYVLRMFFLEHELSPIDHKSSINKMLKELHLERFSAAMMWILKERLGMPEEWMICEADAQEGRRVLKEVMQMGNFGQYDERISKKLVSGVKYYWEKVKRQVRLVRLYPQEVLWDPWWRLETNFHKFTTNYH